MRLDRIDVKNYTLLDPAGQPHGDVGLYADQSNGVVYALTPERRDELDPRWREQALADA